MKKINEKQYTKIENVNNENQITNQENNNTSKIKFDGFGLFFENCYRGEIKINPTNKKIEFKGNDKYLHRYFNNGLNTQYLEITIYNQNESKIIKNIDIGTINTIKEIIEKFNLENGIDYEEGYIIKIYTKEPWRTWFNIGDNNKWERFAFHDSKDWDWTLEYRIRNNNIINKYNDLLWKDFPDAYSSDINLGLINDNIDNDIRHAIKQKYPDFDVNQVSIVDKVDYSHFSKFFLAKISIKDNSEKYFCGVLKPKFLYVTRTKLNEKNNIIANDLKVKQWFEHINEWNSTLPQAINNAKTFTTEHLYNWKRQEKETIKSYIRNWSYVKSLIENELKLDELNKYINGAKSDFDNIKNQVNELNKIVTNLENISNVNCANIATIIGGVISVVPVIGTVGGAVANIASGACAIAGV